MAITTKARRHVSLLDQVVIFPDGAITSAEDRAWMLRSYYSAEGAPPPVFVTGGGSIDDVLDADFYPSTIGQATSDELAGWHVALDGRRYLIDVQQYERSILDSQATQVDDGEEAGEKSLSRSGFWTRPQTDWRHGAGQRVFDGPSSDRQRFLASKGFEVWERDQISLLADTRKKLSSTEDNYTTFDVGGRLYVVDGQFLRFTTNPTVETPTMTSVDCDAAIVDTTTDGNRIYIAFGGSTVLKVVTVGGSSDTTLGTESPNLVEYANGRLIGADGKLLYELSATGTKTDIRDDPRADWAWVAVTGHPEAIFAGGTVNDRSEIYAISIGQTDTALEAPVFAGDLPRGETLNVLGNYAGLVVMGTSKGIRVASVTDQKLFIGELIEVSGGVKCLSFFGKFCWFGWTNFDSETTGIGRMDLSIVTSPETFVPAYASDLMASDLQGVVSGISQFNGEQFFAVVESGLWGATEYLVPAAYLDSGDVRYGVLPEKIFSGVEIRHDPLEGSVGALITFNDGVTRGLGSNDAAGSVISQLDAASGIGLSANLRVIAMRDIDDPTTGPVIQSWQLNALLRPKRVREIILPLILKTKVNTENVDQPQDPLDDIRRLESLCASAEFVVLQEGEETYDVRVESVAIPRGSIRGWIDGGRWFQTTVFVRLLTREF